MDGYTVKESVILWMRPQLLQILAVMRPIWATFHIPLVITSGMEGAHGEKSLHYCGMAFDIRTNFRTDAERLQWANHRETILATFKRYIESSKLPIDFEMESDHLHVEWDERGKG